MRHAGQFIYSKLDFLNCAFGVVPNKLDGLETTADVPAFNCLGINPYFMYYTAIQPSFYINNGMKADGSRKAKRIHSNTFLNMPISCPSEKEQDMICNSLLDLDRLITLHQRKLFEAKNNLKNGSKNFFRKIYQKLYKFDFNFKTYDWEQRKFEKFAQRQSNTMISNPDNPCIEYEDVISEQGILNKDVCSKDAEKNGIIFTEEDILYGKLRPYLHNWLNPDFKGVAVGDWWVLRPINMDKNFLYWLIQTPQYDNAANQSSGTKMPRADWKLVSNTDFYVPISNEEQAKIAGLFEKINTLITLHQREVFYTLKHIFYKVL